MAQQQQSSQGSSDNSMAPVWIIILLFCTGYLVWKAGHQYIVSFMFLINIWQAKFLNLFLNNPLLSNQIYLMQTIDPSTVQWDQLVDMTREVGDFMRYPVVSVLVI